jgi:hypothetical protein
MSREGQKQYGKSDTKKNIDAYGKQLIKEMTNEERDSLGSLSHTLHFDTLLGLNSDPVTRNSGKPGMKPVGVILHSDIDIEVPDIDITRNSDTGIDIEKDIEYRKVIAGEKFCVSYYEFMFLVLRDEYAAFVSYDGYKAVCLSTKTNDFLKPDGTLEVEVVSNSPKGYRRIKLPTPTITFVRGKDEDGNEFDFGSIRDNNMIAIDEKVTEQTWRIKERYKKDKYISRFSELIPANKQAK